MTDAAWLSEPLTTDRLRLRAFAASDVPFLVDLGGDPETWRYLGGVTPVEERRRHVEATFDKPNVFIVTTATAPIGFTTVKPCTHPAAPDVPEVGYTPPASSPSPRKPTTAPAASWNPSA
jgi:RimJ/RimL family protein N-acetyltransferase